MTDLSRALAVWRRATISRVMNQRSKASPKTAPL
jgi:hypothetical protein